MMIVVSFLCVAIVLLQYRAKKLMAPASINAVIWLAVSLTYQIQGDSLDVLRWDAIAVVLVGIATFGFGAVCSERIHFALPQPSRSGGAPSFFLPALLGVLTIGLAGNLGRSLEYVHFVDGMSLFGGQNSWYGSLRNTLIADHHGSFGIWSYFLPLSYAAVAYLLCDKEKSARHYAIITSLVTFGYVFLATGRTFILLFVTILFVVVAYRGWLNKTRSIALLVPLFLIVFWVSPIIAGRVSGGGFNYFMMYFVAPLANFDWGMHGVFACCTHGETTFRTIFAVLAKLGFNVPVVELIQPWAGTKLSGNVYTVFMPYYRDFGLAGVALFLFFFGALHTWISRQASLDNPLAVFLNAIFFYALVMQFFQDQYFSLLSQWVQMIFWMSLLLWIRPIRCASFQKG
uniref:Oligosaccharide repeat unit polymerase n=1 Tax=Dechloromonas aromatica (strain RCB) TaxID=159087 RepID=Q47GK7_DECAR